MIPLDGWTVAEDATGTRRALHQNAAGDRCALIRGIDAAHVLCVRLDCPDEVFDQLKSGAILDAAELALLTIAAQTEPLPATVLRALLA